MRSLDERTYVFIVKLWQERRDIPGAEAKWRGSATEVHDEKTFYFESLPALCEFLERRCGMPVPPTIQESPPTF
jgi:hypothetical protein